jgi:hypothetical protein
MHSPVTPATTLAGTWRLVSYESRTANGDTLHPLGPAPVGQLMYTESGYMSAQLSDPGRPPFASGDRAAGTPSEMRATIEGYIAYFGRFTVDAGRGVVTHHVDGALFPNWASGDQVRHFVLEGARLTIKTPRMRVRGEEVENVLVWERVD